MMSLIFSWLSGFFFGLVIMANHQKIKRVCKRFLIWGRDLILEE